MRKSFWKSMVVVLGLSCVSSSVYAHYPWLAKDSEGKAILFFGETPADRTYKLPASIAAAKVFAEQDQEKPVELAKIESDDLVGLVSSQAVDKESDLNSKITFGVYHGSRLEYYVQHHGGALPKVKPDLDDASENGLRASLVDTDQGVNVFVTFDGQPISNAEVKLYCAEGHEEAKATTDKEGKVFFTDKEVEEGLNAILVGHSVEDKSGELDGKTYKSESHYLTATFAGE